jgi:phage-related protein
MTEQTANGDHRDGRIMPHLAYTCEIEHNPNVKPVVWMGDSMDDLREFPEAVQDSLGFDQYLVQCGLDPKDWKPMASVGVGVKEIRVRDKAGIFRMVYLATRPEGVYVLHCFQKKKTPKASLLDLELAYKRLKAIAG